MTTTPKPLRAPAGLGKAGRLLWRQIATDWAEQNMGPDAREVRLLADACHEADTLALLQAELDTASASGSLVTTGSMGQLVTHPHVAEARRSRAQIAALLKALQLDLPAESGARLGPVRTASEIARMGGLARRDKLRAQQAHRG